jgi:hypothetical protein
MDSVTFSGLLAGSPARLRAAGQALLLHSPHPPAQVADQVILDGGQTARRTSPRQLNWFAPGHSYDGTL